MSVFGAVGYRPYLSDAKTATGAKGEIANVDLIAHSGKFEQETVRVVDGVYNLIGIGLATTTLIEGKTGNIIVDTGDSVWQAERHKEEFAKVSERPLSAVMYTPAALGSGCPRVRNRPFRSGVTRGCRKT